MRFPRTTLLLALACTSLLSPEPSLGADPTVAVDLAATPAFGHELSRVRGSQGQGLFGVPVAAGGDIDGDSLADTAFAAMLGDPDQQRTDAGIAYVVFGRGHLGEELDTGVPNPRVLRILGAGRRENAGSELWIDDVSGDGLADVLVARQNHAPSPSRPGAGALSIILGSPELRAMAERFESLDLASPPSSLTIVTLVGASEFDRVGIWMRSGDLDGDAIADLVVGADQQDMPGGDDNGAAYILRGGSHLETSAIVDLANFGSTSLVGHLARVLPAPAPATDDFHLGATVGMGDLDDNQRVEVFVAAALNRSGASLPADGGSSGDAESVGGARDGALFIVWDDNFPPRGEPWPAGFTIALDDAPGSVTTIVGGSRNVSFGEEMFGGSDYDDDGEADLFVGDIVGDYSPRGNRRAGGSGHLFYSAGNLKGLSFDLDDQPDGIVRVDFLGAASGDIAADTALGGDFDGDGIADLGFTAPKADVLGRSSAGRVYIFYGSRQRLPSLIDLADLPDPSLARIAVIDGALGDDGSDAGDTLGYSAAGSDLDGDGSTDLVINEMEGNGLREEAVDVGNLVVVSGAFVAGFPQTAPCPPRDFLGCGRGAAQTSSLTVDSRSAEFGDRASWSLSRGVTGPFSELGELDLEGDGLRLCFYDARSQKAFAETLLAGASTCGRRSCWQRRGARRWRFKDLSGSNLGIRRLRVRLSTSAALSLRMTARDPVELTDALPLTPPLLVRLVGRRGESTCWDSGFDNPIRNSATRLRARERNEAQ